MLRQGLTTVVTVTDEMNIGCVWLQARSITTPRRDIRTKSGSSLNSRPESRNYRMKIIVRMIREILKMLNQYAVDYPTFPVNQRYSHLIVIAKPQQSAARYLEFAGSFGKRFCKSTSVFFVTLSRRIQSLDFSRNGRHTCTHKYGATRYMW